MQRLSFDELKSKVLSLPLCPGVYIMKDRTGTVIYVGKAKKLKNRVSQYFQDSSAHTGKTRLMVSNIADFDYIIADSEFESLILECSLIKQYQPKYNILLKDDKGYPFIRVDLKEAYPRFTMVGKRIEDNAKYFGPYGGRAVTQAAIRNIQLTLKLFDCNRSFPRDIGKERPCLNYQIGNCDGWCRSCMSAAEYRQRVSQACMMLEGKNGELLSILKSQMEEAAETLAFEQAARLRDRIRSVEALSNKQHVCAGAAADTDVIGLHQGTAKTGFAVLHYMHGNLVDRDMVITDTEIGENAQEAVSAFLKQYYLHRGIAPQKVLVPCKIEDSALISQLLLQNFGRNTKIITPIRGENVRLIELAGSNAREEAERVSTEYERVNKTLEALAAMLALDHIPERLESYDISNLGDSDIVAAMVVFKGGKASKNDYRKFRLRGLEHQDDYASMQQVLHRRFENYLAGDAKFVERPDVLLIDGGTIHADTVRRTLSSMGISIPIFGMVKDSKHRTRALVTPDGEEIGIQTNPAVFSLIGTIQEETHRFAITYQKELRSKRIRTSVLDTIPGVGEKRKQTLLKTFGSLKKIKSADISELESAVPKAVAAQIYYEFHQKEQKEHTGNLPGNHKEDSTCE